MKEKLLWALLPVLFLGACNTKYEESSPTSVDLSHSNAAERMKGKEDFDAGIQDLNDALYSFSRLLAQYTHTQSLMEGSEVRDEVSALIRNSNNHLKLQIPEVEGHSMVRSTPMEIAPSEAYPCGSIIILARYTRDEAGHTLNYSSENCKGEQKTLFSVSWEKNVVTANWLDSSLQKNLSGLNENIDTKNTTCVFSLDENKRYKLIECKNLILKANESQQLIVEDIAFENSQKLILKSQTSLFQGEKIKNSTGHKREYE